MTQEKQDRDEIKWVTELTSVMGIELREAPRKQDVPKADIALTVVDAGRERRVDVEVVEAIDQPTRAGYNGARTYLVKETTEELRRRRLNANVGLMFDNGVLALIQAQPAERRLMATKIADLVAATLARPKPAEQPGWVWRDEEPDRTERRLEYLGLLSLWGIKFLRTITVSPWIEPVVLTAAGGLMDSPQLIQEAIDKRSPSAPSTSRARATPRRSGSWWSAGTAPAACSPSMSPSGSRTRVLSRARIFSRLARGNAWRCRPRPRRSARTRSRLRTSTYAISVDD